MFKDLFKIIKSLVLFTPGFLYMVRFCLVFLTIYLLEIPGFIFTPIADNCLFPVPVIGVYIFGISGVNASLSACPVNNRLAKWG